jgi:hypothetical protein
MCYMNNVIVWDIETVPDLQGFAAANGHVGKSDDEIRAELGDKFPKHIYHSIICIGALVAHREEGGPWSVDALGAPIPDIRIAEDAQDHADRNRATDLRVIQVPVFRGVSSVLAEMCGNDMGP